MSPNPQFPTALVTFTEKTLNGKLHFLCSDYYSNSNGLKISLKNLNNFKEILIQECKF